MLLIAHSGHWLVTIGYFVPVGVFLIWLAISHIRARREDEPSQ